MTISQEQLESTINNRVNQLIANTIAKHGLRSRDELPQAALDDAKRTATAQVEREQAEQENPFYRQLQEEREKSRLLEMQLSALKESRPSPASTGAVPNANLTYERAVAKIGRVNWASMTNDQRLASVGISANEINNASRDEIRSIFGRNPDSAKASDLAKSSPSRYQKLKLIGLALNLI